MTEELAPSNEPYLPDELFLDEFGPPNKSPFVDDEFDLVEEFSLPNDSPGGQADG